MEIKSRPTKELTISASYGYNDIKFDKFQDAKGTYKGNTKPFSPKYNYNLSAKYRNEAGYFAQANVNGYGKIYLDNANINERKSYSLVNTKVGLEKESYDLYLYAKNLFDKDYSTHKFAEFYTVYSESREFGVQLAYRF